MPMPDVREGNPVKDRLADGGTVVGSFLRMPAAEIAELCGHAGCDFVLIDLEHGALSWERVAALISAAESAGAAPIVRLPTTARDPITRALDIGAHGVMVARVDTAEEAQVVADAARYGSGGTRGAAGNRRTGYGLRMDLGEFVAAANRATFVSVQIETMRAVHNAEAIAAVPGLDCLFMGLSDLSVDLDIPGQWTHDDVLEATASVRSACDRHRVALGVPAPDVRFAQQFAEHGARLIACGDTGVFGQAMRSFVDGVRSFTD